MNFDRLAELYQKLKGFWAVSDEAIPLGEDEGGRFMTLRDPYNRGWGFEIAWSPNLAKPPFKDFCGHSGKAHRPTFEEFLRILDLIERLGGSFLSIRLVARTNPHTSSIAAAHRYLLARHPAETMEEAA